jgi:hypothetical protein
MPRREKTSAATVLERGTILFLFRPRVQEQPEEQDPRSADDVQRILTVLGPAQGPWRIVAIGRKRLPDAGSHERFWGFVDFTREDPREVVAELGPRRYGTKTLGVRHLPKARIVGEGAYVLALHDGHSHLLYELGAADPDDEMRSELNIASRGNYLVSVANPDPAVWDLPELPAIQLELFDEGEVHTDDPPLFPPHLQERFRGNRYAPLDTVELLDHPGAELLFIAASEQLAELGIALDPTWERAERIFGDVEV